MIELTGSCLKMSTTTKRDRIIIRHKMAGHEYIYAIVPTMEAAARVIENAKTATGYLEIKIDGKEKRYDPRENDSIRVAHRFYLIKCVQ